MGSTSSKILRLTLSLLSWPHYQALAAGKVQIYTLTQTHGSGAAALIIAPGSVSTELPPNLAQDARTDVNTTNPHAPPSPDLAQHPDLPGSPLMAEAQVGDSPRVLPEPAGTAQALERVAEPHPSLEGEDPESLIRRIAEGDPHWEEAFARLVSGPFKEQLVRTFFSEYGHRYGVEIEGAVNEAFEEYWRRIVDHKPVWSERWFYVVVEHLIINQLRRSKTSSSLDKMRENSGFEPEAPEALTDEEREALEALDGSRDRLHKEQVDKIKFAMPLLTLKQREAIDLALQGLSTSEIASKLGVDYDIARDRLKNAQSRLKKIMTLDDLDAQSASIETDGNETHPDRVHRIQTVLRRPNKLLARLRDIAARSSSLLDDEGRNPILSLHQREVVGLSLKGLSIPETSRELGVPYDQVYSNLSEAVRKLEKRLADTNPNAQTAPREADEYGIDQYLVEDIRTAMGLLPLEQRAVLDPSLRGLTTIEIAGELNLDPVTVQHRLSQARGNVRKILTNDNPDVRLARKELAKATARLPNVIPDFDSLTRKTLDRVARAVDAIQTALHTLTERLGLETSSSTQPN